MRSKVDIMYVLDATISEEFIFKEMIDSVEEFVHKVFKYWIINNVCSKKLFRNWLSILYIEFI